jgi:triacylglycerol lipase
VGHVWWHSGHPNGWRCWAWLLIVGGYALVLGLEFSLLRLAHGPDDPTPRVQPGAAAAAWWARCRARRRCSAGASPFAASAGPTSCRPTPGPARRAAGARLCLQPRPVEPLAAALHGAGCALCGGQPGAGVRLSIDDYIALLEQAVRRLEQATGLAPVVVAHSMGGLALRRWWAEQGDDGRVHHALTIGTPHHGTWLARFA